MTLFSVGSRRPAERLRDDQRVAGELPRRRLAGHMTPDDRYEGEDADDVIIAALEILVAEVEPVVASASSASSTSSALSTSSGSCLCSRSSRTPTPTNTDPQLSPAAPTPAACLVRGSLRVGRRSLCERNACSSTVHGLAYGSRVKARTPPQLQLQRNPRHERGDDLEHTA
jgi:hypothetical protein